MNTYSASQALEDLEYFKGVELMLVSDLNLLTEAADGIKHPQTLHLEPGSNSSCTTYKLCDPGSVFGPL